MGKKISAKPTTKMPSPAAMEMEGICQEEDDLIFFEEQRNDFSYWELINPSDAVDSDNESLISLENGFVTMYAFYPSSPPKSPETNPEEQTQNQITFVGSVISADYDHHEGYDDGLDDKKHGDKEDEEEEEEEEDDHDDRYVLDDELVPGQVSGKLGRQRMKKLGKRVFSKVSNSMQNRYRYVKPGCVYGKHGLGINA